MRSPIRRASSWSTVLNLAPSFGLDDTGGNPLGEFAEGSRRVEASDPESLTISPIDAKSTFLDGDRGDLAERNALSRLAAVPRAGQDQRAARNVEAAGTTLTSAFPRDRVRRSEHARIVPLRRGNVISTHAHD